MATFSATPLVLAPLATEFEVSTGTAALFSGAQLGSFVVGSWTAGRFVVPSRRLFVIGLVTLSAANVVAAFVGSFVVLVVTRSVSGLALGVLTWLAYSQVFGDDERTGDITTVGPLTAVVSAPIIGVLLELGDVRGCSSCSPASRWCRSSGFPSSSCPTAPPPDVTARFGPRWSSSLP